MRSLAYWLEGDDGSLRLSTTCHGPASRTRRFRRPNGPEMNSHSKWLAARNCPPGALAPSVRCQSVYSRSNRRSPVDLVANLKDFPESAANVPEANLKTPVPLDSVPPPGLITEAVPSVICVTASPPGARWVPPPIRNVP